MTQKSKIFISHANPDDNYFALWLSNKLEILGYDTWVDVKKVPPGDYFNQLYEDALRNETVIFLPILTLTYIVPRSLLRKMKQLIALRSLHVCRAIYKGLQSCKGCSWGSVECSAQYHLLGNIQSSLLH
jgi:hypothetical protein